MKIEVSTLLLSVHLNILNSSCDEGVQRYTLEYFQLLGCLEPMGLVFEEDVLSLRMVLYNLALQRILQGFSSYY